MTVSRREASRAGQDPHVAWCVEWERARKAWNDAEDCMEECGKPHDHAEPDARCDEAVTDELHEQYIAIQYEILNTPARTIAGLAVQARLIELHIRHSDGGCLEHDCIKTMAVTLENMADAGRAA